MKKFKIFVINLDRSPERMKSISNQLNEKGISFERISACDGKILPEEIIQQFYSPKANRKQYVRPLHRGQLGCYLSHIKAWRKIIDEELDYAVILEDDIDLEQNFVEGLDFLNSHFGEWDFVRIQRNAKKKRIFIENKFEKFSLVEYLNTPGDTAGQVVSCFAATKMLKELIPFGTPVDIGQQYYYKIGVRLISLLPGIVKMGTISSTSDLESCNVKKFKSHHPFVRFKLSVSFYISRMFCLIKQHGFFRVLCNLLILNFRKTII